MEKAEWKTTFQVIIPDILEPEKFRLGRQKFLDRLWREIEPIRNELDYPKDASNEEKLIWRIGNKDLVEKRMQEICSRLWLPDTKDFINLLVGIFFDGINSNHISIIDNTFPFNIRDTSPLFFLAVAIPPDINQIEPEDQDRFLTNGLFVEGMIPGLSEESFNNVFKRKGDFIIRGNLALFNATAFREVGKWLEELKHQIGGQDVFVIRPGRSSGPSLKNEGLALRMYEIYLDVKKSYQGKQRKRRKGHSRYDSIYDEVARNYEAKYRLESGSLSINHVKYLIQKGRRIFEANKGGKNPA
jgi:hypothetical protein